MAETQTETLELAAAAVRDAMGSVRSGLFTRKQHPTFISKTEIRAALERAAGMVGLYAVLAGEASHPFAPGVSGLFGAQLLELQRQVQAQLA